MKDLNAKYLLSQEVLFALGPEAFFRCINVSESARIFSYCQYVCTKIRVLFLRACPKIIRKYIEFFFLASFSRLFSNTQKRIYFLQFNTFFKKVSNTYSLTKFLHASVR